MSVRRFDDSRSFEDDTGSHVAVDDSPFRTVVIRRRRSSKRSGSVNDRRYSGIVDPARGDRTKDTRNEYTRIVGTENEHFLAEKHRGSLHAFVEFRRESSISMIATRRAATNLEANSRSREIEREQSRFESRSHRVDLTCRVALSRTPEREEPSPVEGIGRSVTSSGQNLPLAIVIRSRARSFVPTTTGNDINHAPWLRSPYRTYPRWRTKRTKRTSESRF